MLSGARNKKFPKATVQAGVLACSPHSLPRSNMQATSAVDSARTISVPQPSGTDWYRNPDMFEQGERIFQGIN